MKEQKIVAPKRSTVHCGPLLLSSGELLEHVELQYERVGPIDAPVILVCHALTGNEQTVGTEEEPGWWRGLIGPGKYIDTACYQVLTFNVLGGCDGSTGATSVDPITNEPYRINFPDITIRDMVRAQYQALEALEITQLECVIGGSLGGMQALEWATMYPDMIKKLIVLAATPYLTDYGIAYNHIARTAIITDPNFKNGQYSNASRLTGFEIARMIGMVTYRTPELFRDRFNRRHNDTIYDVNSYLNYQGKKLLSRFDPNSYLTLLNAMDTHDIGYNRGGIEKVAQSLTCPVLLLSYDKDLIFEPSLIKQFNDQLPNATHHHIETNFGHDGFLTEYYKWGHYVKQFLYD